MADVNFRGVVLSSCWRLAYRDFKIPRDADPGKPWKRDTPDKITYFAQPWETEPLIRQALLYFDKIVLPINDDLPAPPIPGIEYLVDAGAVELKPVALNFPKEVEGSESFKGFLKHMREQVAQSPNLAIGGRREPGRILVPAYVAAAHRQAFIDLNRAQRGAWSFAAVGQGIDDFVNDRSALGYQLELIDCLPYPHSAASYAKIMSFKRTHWAALIDLRGALDDAHDRIGLSGDPAAIASIEFRRLQEAMRALIEHADRTRLEHFLGRVKIEHNPALWVAHTLAGSAFGEMLQGGGMLGEMLHGQGLPFPLPLLGAVGLAATLLVRITENKCPVDAAYAYVYEGLQAGAMSKLPAAGNEFVSLQGSAEVATDRDFGK